jgi:hypothetical protein
MEPNTSDVKQYTDQLLELYRHTPGTLGCVRREDRSLARELHGRGVSLSIVQEAFLLATARRCLRAPDAAPLAPVRSLHYFVPVMEEIMATPLLVGYADYLKWKLRKVQAEHDGALLVRSRRAKPG